MIKFHLQLNVKNFCVYPLSLIAYLHSSDNQTIIFYNTVCFLSNRSLITIDGCYELGALDGIIFEIAIALYCVSICIIAMRELNVWGRHVLLLQQVHGAPTIRCTSTPRP